MAAPIDDADQFDRPPPGRRDAGWLTFRDVTVARPRRYRPLRLDLRVPPGPRPAPVIVWIHGGSWRTGSRLDLPAPLAAAGFAGRILRRSYALAAVEYRLSREAVFPAQLHDVKAAIRWLRAFAGELGLAPDRFAAWGESAGGHLAALAGLTGSPAARPVPGGSGPELEGDNGLPGVPSAVQAVVDWYGPVDLVGDERHWAAARAAGHPHAAGDGEAPDEWLLGGRRSERRAEAAVASPVRYAHPGAPPFVCVHGTADPIVPYAQSELLASALRAHGVRCDLHPVPDAGHVFAGAPDVGALVELSLDFLDEVLAPPR